MPVRQRDLGSISVGPDTDDGTGATASGLTRPASIRSACGQTGKGS